MRQADVTVGETYLTLVSGMLVPVRVDHETTRESYSSGRKVTVYRVSRDGQPLPKSRSAAALRPLHSTMSHRQKQLCVAGFTVGMKSLTHGAPFVATAIVARAMRSLCSAHPVQGTEP